MPPDHVKTSILAALGLTAALAGCKNDGSDTDTDLGACLDFATEVGPGTDDTGLGPCLDIPPDTDVDTDSDSDSDTDTDSSRDARRRVLDRGVLPSDVSAILKRRGS